MNDCAPPPSSRSPGGVRIAALLLGAIEAPHEASSQLARASEVTWKWSVSHFSSCFAQASPTPRVLNILLQSVLSHSVHALGARVFRGTAIVR